MSLGTPIDARWWLAQLLPRWPAWVVGLVTALVTGLGGFAFLAALPDAQPAWVFANLALYVLLPPSVGLFVAGMLAGAHLPRAMLFGVSTLVLLASWLAVMAAMVVEANPWGAVTITLLVYGPLGVLVGPSTLAYGLGAVGEVRMHRDRERRVWVIRACREHAQPIDLLARLGGLEADLVVAVLERQAELGVLDGRVEDGMWFPTEVLEQKQAELLAAVEAEGDLRLEDAAEQLGVPVRTIEHWVYELVFADRFLGYLNWNEKRLISAEAGKLGDQTSCPSCGGRLGAAGGGLARCGSCGTERFLEVA